MLPGGAGRPPRGTGLPARWEHPVLSLLLPFSCPGRRPSRGDTEQGPWSQGRATLVPPTPPSSWQGVLSSARLVSAVAAAHTSPQACPGLADPKGPQVAPGAPPQEELSPPGLGAAPGHSGLSAPFGAARPGGRKGGHGLPPAHWPWWGREGRRRGEGPERRPGTLRLGAGAGGLRAPPWEPCHPPARNYAR